MMIQGGEDTDGAGSGGIVGGRGAGGAPRKPKSENGGSAGGADTDGAGTKGMVKKQDTPEETIRAPD